MDARSDLWCRGAHVETQLDQRHCARVDVRTEDGVHAARAGARLVRRAVLDAAERGARTAVLTLDVSSPSTGFVLDELRGALGRGIADVRVRRAGGTLLADVRLERGPWAPAHGQSDTAAATAALPTLGR